MERVLSVVLLTSLLTGCAVIRARNDMEASKAEYKQCLREHSEDTSKCDAYRAMYEADLKAYRATTDAMREGSTVTIIDD